MWQYCTVHRFDDESAWSHSVQELKYEVLFLFLGGRICPLQFSTTFSSAVERANPHISFDEGKVPRNEAIHSNGQVLMFEQAMFYIFEFGFNIGRACCETGAFEEGNHYSCPQWLGQGVKAFTRAPRIAREKSLTASFEHLGIRRCGQMYHLVLPVF
ncbi:uncharacterized protein LOC122828966 isoform X2 [Gambusia affinis]|uniref:uncharacterized protein LOC122828966 isoform X2 n=1 Tax=Gambusia affinis TaxID=33528 RepID=UPI001CDC0D9D|nr:uncharacterized protein LOC122828966 isoform X2 [Gambusia affinis]